MSNLQEMPQPQGADELKRIAQEHFDAIKTAAVLESSSSLKIGYHAAWIKRNNRFGILGFRDEMEAMESAGVSKSCWFSVIHLAESFIDLPEELFCGMKLLNATALADMPESKRVDREWVKAATEKPVKDFKAMVDEAMNGKARASEGKERTTKLTIDMPVSRKTVIEEKAREFAQAHDMDPADVGKAIEIAMVEATGGSTMVGAIVNAVQRLKKVKELCESGLSSDEILGQVLELNEASILEFAAVLEQKVEDEAAA
jgi:hypothetical protein